MRHIYQAAVCPPLPGDAAVCGRIRRTIPTLDQSTNQEAKCPACERTMRRAAQWHPHAVGYAVEQFRAPV